MESSLDFRIETIFSWKSYLIEFQIYIAYQSSELRASFIRMYNINGWSYESCQ